MEMSMRNKIIIEILQGNFETKDLVKYLGCSERYAQSVKKELKEQGEKGIEFIPICSICGEGFRFLINVIMNKEWKKNISDRLASCSDWHFDDDGFFYCKNCNRGDSVVKEIKEDDVFIGVDAFKNVDPIKEEEEMSKKHKNNNRHLDKYAYLKNNEEVDFMLFENKPENKPIESKEADTWEVKLDCVSECSKAPESIDVYLSAISISKMRLFMNWSGRQEWLAYLIGESKDNKIFVNDLLLPKQKASVALVSNVDCENYNGIVGVIHSHHEMGGASNPEKPGFSGHDENFINGNHDVSLLIAKDGISGHVRIKVACGAFKRVKANIHKMIDDRIDKEQLKKEFEEKILTTTTANNNEDIRVLKRFGDGNHFIYTQQ